jgi:hypothetical protein
LTIVCSSKKEIETFFAKFSAGGRVLRNIRRPCRQVRARVDVQLRSAESMRAQETQPPPAASVHSRMAARNAEP